MYNLNYVVKSCGTLHYTGVTQDLLQLAISCSVTPDVWCRAQLSGDCFCVPHNDAFLLSSNSDFPENTSFLENSISFLVNQSEFRKTFAGSFLVCAVDRSIHRAFHISGILMSHVCYRNVSTS